MRPLLATMAAIMAIGLVGGVLRFAMRAATSATISFAKLNGFTLP